MTLTDKEIALELTKAYLGHLNARASSNNISASHIKAENVATVYELYFSTVSKAGISTTEE
ncbi:hypothetical protein [Psychrobacillus sp. NPDC096389]|uniref:hypothetical protein n=1 Tax=Psychrobacillus sp. NPDC096389 TaxID=3364490 RepID=UPI00381B7D63